MKLLQSYSDVSLDSGRRRRVRRIRPTYWGWFLLLASLGAIKLFVDNAFHQRYNDEYIGQGQQQPQSPESLERLRAYRRQAFARRAKPKQQITTGMVIPQKQGQDQPQHFGSSPELIARRCTDELHKLIDQQDLDWTQKRSLPNFKVRDDKGGGVIVFWHLAKTGGTTVRKECATLPGVDYMLLLSPDDYIGGSKAIAERLTPSWDTTVDNHNHGRNHTLFVELHGMQSLSALEMETQIRHWRELSQQHDTPLFIFTLFREPTTYSLSYFNFFHQGVTIQPPQQELTRLSYNRQCRTLASPGNHNKRGCAELYSKLYELFDWVGTTERLSEETLPLLQHLLRFKDEQQVFATNATTSFLLPTNDNNTVYNVARNITTAIQLESLTPYSVQKLEEKTCLDRGLWERAKRDYTLNMWKDTINGRPSSRNRE